MPENNETAFATMASRHARAATLALLTSCLAVSPAGAVNKLNGFFPVPSVATQGEVVEPTDCDTPLPAVVKLETVSKYDQKDSNRTKIDKEGEKKFKEDIKPIAKFTSKVVRYGNQYMASYGRKIHSAQCSLQWLESWAKAGALTDVRNDKSFNTVGKYIGGMAIAYLEIRDVHGLNEESKQTVEKWLAKMADNLVRFHTDNPDTTSSLNNHRYWSGLGIAAAGVAAGRADLLGWGMEAARIGIRQIAEDGTMPLELDREERARDYHLYALTPLVMLAELGEMNGVHLYEENNGALKRLANLVISTFDHPDFFVKKTGKKQLDYPDSATRISRLSFLEPYNARFPSSEGRALLETARPVKSSFTGGDMTLIYTGQSR